MSENLITKYLTYKKKRLASYGLALYSDLDYRSYILECLQKYINNYIEVIYHQELETLDKIDVVTRDIINIEQEGMRLELLDALATREILETNEGYKKKQEIVNITKEVVQLIISFDQTNVTEQNIKVVIERLTRKKNIPFRESAKTDWIKAWQETKKQEAKLLEPKENFLIQETPYQEDNSIKEITVLPHLKQLEIYKKSLIERVYQEEKVTYEKIKLSLILLNQKMLKRIIEKKKLGTYIINIPEEIWSNKENIKELFSLLDDKILKEHIVLGISYNTLINSKAYQEKQKKKFQFACLQDFTHINDIPAKIDSIDTPNLFSYLIVTGYKGKDLQELQKQEPVNMKAILFSKEG